MELDILSWIHDNLHGSGFINNVFKYITYLGESGIAWLIVGLVLMCFRKTRQVGFVVCVNFCAVVVVNHFGLKLIFNRTRPFVGNESLTNFIAGMGMELPDSGSFPSGHTFISFSSAMVLTLMLGKIGAWSLIPATLISISRIFLCVHYPTDVLGGMILGVLCGWGVTVLTNYILKKFFIWWGKRKSNKSCVLESANEVTAEENQVANTSTVDLEESNIIEETEPTDSRLQDVEEIATEKEGESKEDDTNE